MSWFNKEEKIPSIPRASNIVDLPNVPNTQTPDLPELPSFPNTNKNEILNQEMVKSAVADLPNPGENEVNVDIPKGIRVEEMKLEESRIPPIPSQNISQKELLPNLPIHKPSNEFKESMNSISPVVSKTVDRSTEPVFVRIDKFQSAQKNFDNIKEKVSEVESVLKKIKDVKTREEEELNSWAKEIESLKLKLKEIDSDIFDQI